MTDHRPKSRNGIVRADELPGTALLRKYVDAGSYTDCYVTEIARPVSHADFVEAFYTSSLFKIERLILSALVARPSTDAQARQLADGKISSFAAWIVEDRTSCQLLLSDFRGRTRSWLMTAPAAATGSTCLYFGSAVVPVIDGRSGATRMGPGFSLLLGIHKRYSRALLRAAVARLSRVTHLA